MASWIHVRPDAIYVWRRHPDLEERLSWYVRVMRGEAPPKYRLARAWRMTGYDSLEELEEASEEELWRSHEREARAFRDWWRRLRDGEEEPPDREELRSEEPSLLDLKTVLAYRLASPCRLCERRCMAERAQGRRGACRLDLDTYVHSAFLHLGEEAPLVPSGTIFYGGCNFTCVFCQNWDVSQWHAREGTRVTPRMLAEIQDKLAARGARNINHVGGDPVPSIHTIIDSMRHATHWKPQLWNSNMYMTSEALELLADLIDIWLPDLKFGNNKCALRLAATPNYWEVTTRNIKTAAQHGDMIIRHLVMPDHLECCTKPVLKWIAENLPKHKIIVNVMSQYTPDNLVLRIPRKWPELTRRPTTTEIQEAQEYAENLGLKTLDT